MTAPLLLQQAPSILREYFRKLPEVYFTRQDRDVSISCPCGEQFDLSFGQIRECGCRRFYFNGHTVHVASAPAPEDDIDVCEVCWEERRVDEGQRVLLGGVDSFVCERCLEPNA